MRIRRQPRLLATLLAAMLATTACSATEIQPLILLVANGQSGTFTAIEDQSDSYALTLDGVEPTMVWFTDRPEREAGTVDLQTALTKLYEDASVGAPNAALAIADPAAGSDVVIVELTEPRYDAASRKLEFTATILNTPKRGLAVYAARAGDSFPAAFGQASLFIDTIGDWIQEVWTDLRPEPL